MTVLAIKSFGGIAPKVPPRYLKDNQAQVAVNGPMFNGSLQSLNAPGSTVATLTKTGSIKTIYRFGQSVNSESNYWFHWTTDVDVCRSQIAGDTSEWTFFTGDGIPKATNSSLALSGSNYPTVSRPLGLPAPSAAAIATLGALPTDTNALQETRVYTYTYVSKESGYTFESAPAPPAGAVDVYPFQNVTVASFATQPAGYNATHIRIYRSTAGVYLYVGEITVGTSSFVDSVTAEDLAEELTTLTWLPPPETLSGLINLPNGVMAGFTGRDIYLCDPYHPHAWPVEYSQTVDYPIVGLGRMDTTLAVLTTGTPYFLQGSHPDSMVLVKSDVEQACASKASIVSVNNSVLYASPDGLVALTPGGSKLLTEELFTRAQWQATFYPSTIHAHVHDMKYVAFYDNGVVQGGFIFDLTTGELLVHDEYAAAGYTDLLNDKLYISNASKAVKVWLAGSAKTYTWRSKKFSMPRPMGFACAQVEAEAYPITAKFYVDNSTTPKFTVSVASRLPFRLPVLVGLDWEVQLEGTGEVFSCAIAQTIEELKSV